MGPSSGSRDLPARPSGGDHRDHSRHGEGSEHRERHRRKDKRHKGDRRRSVSPARSSGSDSNGPASKRRRNEDTAPEEHEEVKAAPPIDDRREKRMLAWRQQRQAAAAAAAAAAAQTAAPREGGDRSALQVPLGRPSSGTGASTSPRRGWNLEDEASASEDEGDSGQRAQEAATLASNGGSAPPPPPLRHAVSEGEEGPQRGALGTTNHAPAAVGADDDEEIDPLDAFMAQNDAALASTTLEPTSPTAGAPPDEGKEGDNEVDPLDAFMAGDAFQRDLLPTQATATTATPPAPGATPASAPSRPTGVRSAGLALARPASLVPAGLLARGGAGGPGAAPAVRRARPPSRRDSDSQSEAGSDSDASGDGLDEEDEDEDDAEWMRKLQAGKLSKGDRLAPADHASIAYAPFRRNFYREPEALARLGEEEVARMRAELDGVRVRGRGAPRPLANWHQAGLSGRLYELLRRDGFEAPLPIQAQALPAIMSGRDTIGIAKTGSGKTLAYVLPLLRHVKDQPPLALGDGPIALVMAPTRELVSQITREVRRFGKPLGVRATAVYGGSGVANQISELKRGSEAVVCTPGRMIDILVTSGGKITNLRRVTYLVLDEADRMFDMGFEPQIARIVNNIRPDRQTVMFSATFPRQVEGLARALLADPVEIQVGGRSVVNADIAQFVELRAEEDRLWRLLELLGEWYERGKLLVFVASQERCDNLFRDLLRHGYPCLSLHGGKDQSDRESTISDFKSDVCNILIATSVAARGLDVKDLVLVVNYDVPNHLEDYVHRVGRTGRAGRAGTAVTFIAPEEEQHAPDVVRALRESGAAVPADLAALAESFEAKRRAGTAKLHGSGFGGSGFKFSSAEDNLVKALRRATAKEYGIVEGDEEEEAEAAEGGDGIREVVKKELDMQSTVENEAELAALPPEQQARAREAQRRAKETLDRLAAAGAGPPGSAPGAPISGIRSYVVGGGAEEPAPLPGAAPAAQALPAAPVPASAFAASNIVPVAGPALAPGAATALAAAAGGVAPNADLLAAAARISQQINAAAGLAPAPAPAAAVGAGPATLPPDSIASLLQAMQPQAGVRPPAVAAAAAGRPAGPTRHFETELEINDFPQRARWKVTHRDTINDMGELGAAVVIKGTFYPPGAKVAEGDRKIYLHIEGPTEQIVRRAKGEIKRIIEEETERAMRREAPAAGRALEASGAALSRRKGAQKRTRVAAAGM
ncbi:hypothetical protein ACKKBF_B21785 [Auxenochlorella protothecoides x Auxenochlorella symbiontica]